jgi:hypothetical protein
MIKIRIFTDHLPYKLGFVIVLSVLCLSTGCRIDGDREVDRSRFSFKTGDDTELFFRNVRQSDYDLENNKIAKFNVFRHEDRPVADSIPWINPAIVVNYLQDEAYILIEPSPRLQDLEILTLIHPAGQDTITLETSNREANLEFATKIYEHLRQGDSLQVFTGDSYVPFLSDRIHAEAFRITLSDYFRLTRVF